MLIQYASDLHLEFLNNRRFLKKNLLKPVAPYLILAGDIDVFHKGKVREKWWFEYFSKNWEQVYIIPGNHEYYQNQDACNTLHLDYAVHDNVRYINNQKITIEGVDVYFTTLWSKLSNHLIEQYIGDFHCTKFNGIRYSATHHNALFLDTIQWLQTELALPKKNKRVVVSHFVPSLKVDAYPPAINDHTHLMKEYFVADLDLFLERWDIDYWIYGHNHRNNDTKVFDIQFLSNQLGYVQEDEHKEFVFDKVLEV